MASSKKWTPEQISYIMERSTAGKKPAQIEQGIKLKWPEREIAKKGVSNLIIRQNRKKSKRQENTQESRETSTAPSVRSEIHGVSKAQASSPSVPETPQVQLRTALPEEFVARFGAAKIRPFATTPATIDQPTPASSLLTQDTLPPPDRKSIESPPSVQKVQDIPETPASRTSIPQVLRNPYKPISPAIEPKVEIKSPEGSRLPSLPFLPLAILTSSLPATSLVSINQAKDEADHPFLPAPGIDIPESIVNSARDSFESPFTGLVNEPLSHESDEDEDNTAPNSPILTSETHDEPVPAAEQVALNTRKKSSTERSSSGSESDILDWILKDDLLNIVQPELELTEPVKERPAKKLKIENKRKEIEIETDSKLTVDHMKAGLNVIQALASSTMKESNKSISKHKCKSEQEQKPSEALNNRSSPQETIAQPKMSNFFETLGSEIVVIIVGPKRKECPIHANLLRDNSTLFKDFKFAVNDLGQAEYSLPDANPDALAFVFNWLYRQGLEFFPGSGNGHLTGSKLLTNTTMAEPSTRIIEVYILAEKLGMVNLMDLVMVELGKVYCRVAKFPTPNDIVMTYNHTPSGSHLRKYMARSYQALADLEDDKLESEGWTAEQVGEVVSEVPALFKDFRALNRKTKVIGLAMPAFDRVCLYHAHGADADCQFKDRKFIQLGN